MNTRSYKRAEPGGELIWRPSIKLEACRDNVLAANQVRTEDDQAVGQIGGERL